LPEGPAVAGLAAWVAQRNNSLFCIAQRFMHVGLMKKNVFLTALAHGDVFEYQLLYVDADICGCLHWSLDSTRQLAYAWTRHRWACSLIL